MSIVQPTSNHHLSGSNRLPHPNGSPASRPAAPAANGAAAPLNLGTLVPDPAALAALPRALAERLRVVPLQRRGDVLAVAMADPNDVHTIDEVARVTRCRIAPVAAGAAE